MIRSLYSLLFLAAPLVVALGGSSTTTASPAPYGLTRREEHQVVDLYDACPVRNILNSLGAEKLISFDMEVTDVSYLGGNTYNVTIHVSGKINIASYLFRGLHVSDIDGPDSEVTLYSTTTPNLLNLLCPSDYTANFLVYGVEQGDTVWLPSFRLVYEYSNGLPGVLETVNQLELITGCLEVDSSLSGYYWPTPDDDSSSAPPSGSGLPQSAPSTNSCFQSSTSAPTSSQSDTLQNKDPVGYSTAPISSASSSSSAAQTSAASSGPSAAPVTDASSTSSSAPTSGATSGSSAPSNDANSSTSGSSAAQANTVSSSSSAAPATDASSSSSSAPTSGTTSGSSAPSNGANSSTSGSSAAQANTVSS
ncbi:hypothetical protein ZYGR_0R01200, partial [Zygosaccharomyces rouxii]